MRSGGLDALIRIVKPGALQRDGRSRVPNGDALVADNVPCEYQAGVGTERFANEENAATAPAVFIIRREPDVEDVDAIHAVILLEGDPPAPTHRFAVKSCRPWPRDPLHSLEIAAVRDAG